MGRYAAVVLAVALTAAIFGPALAGPFLWDDAWQVERNPALRDSGGLARLLTTDSCESAGERGCILYHPLPMATLWLQARTTGLSIVFFRLGNLVFHLLAAWLLWQFLRRQGIGRTGALAATFLFLVHPSITEPVMWVVGRQDSLAALCSMGAILAWPDGGNRNGWRRAALAGLLYALALLSKEPFMVVIVLLFARTVFDRLPWRKRLAWLAWPAGSILAVVGVRHALGISSITGGGSTVAQALLGYPAILWHYLVQLATLANGPTVASFHPFAWPAAVAVYVGIVAVSAPVAWAAWSGSRRAAVVLLGLLWFLASLLPHVVSVPAFGVYGNRYAYFPLMGLLIAVAAAAEAAQRRIRPAFLRAAGLAFAIVIVALSFRTAAEARAWQDDLALVSRNLDPDDGWGLFRHANARLTRFGCEAALPELARSVELAPGLGPAWHNLAGCLLSTGRYEGAVTAATRALALQSGDAGAEYNLGAALVFTGQIQPGIAHLERATRLGRGHAMAAQFLATLRAAPASTPESASPR
jgi:hypothetical protein